MPNGKRRIGIGLLVMFSLAPLGPGTGQARAADSIGAAAEGRWAFQPARDRLSKAVAAMKKEGIYVAYSPYWAGPARIKPSMGVLAAGGKTFTFPPDALYVVLR